MATGFSYFLKGTARSHHPMPDASDAQGAGRK